MNRDVTNLKLFCQYLQSWTFLSKIVRLNIHLYTTMYMILAHKKTTLEKWRSPIMVGHCPESPLYTSRHCVQRKKRELPYSIKKTKTKETTNYCSRLIPGPSLAFVCIAMYYMDCWNLKLYCGIQSSFTHAAINNAGRRGEKAPRLCYVLTD